MPSDEPLKVRRMTELQKAILQGILDTDAGDHLQVEDVIAVVQAVEKRVIANAARAASVSQRSLERMTADSPPPAELVYVPGEDVE